MEKSFSQLIQLEGMSLNTYVVVLVMIIFLVALIVGVGLVFKNQYDRRKRAYEENIIKKSFRSKGF